MDRLLIYAARVLMDKGVKSSRTWRPDPLSSLAVELDRELHAIPPMLVLGASCKAKSPSVASVALACSGNKEEVLLKAADEHLCKISQSWRFPMPVHYNNETLYYRGIRKTKEELK